MSRQLQSFPVSRRELLRGALGAACGLLTRAVPRGGMPLFSVAMIVPPPWIQKAYECIRKTQLPKIPKDSITLTSDAGDARTRIQRAIDELAAKGGGRVSLAAGRWQVQGPLILRSRLELHLEEGATLIFSGDREHYLPAVLTRWEGTDLYGYSPCIYAREITDVAITGRGTLEMSRRGDIESWRFDQTEAQRKLRMMGATGVLLEQRVFAPSGFLRPSFIQFLKCERVLVEGVKVGAIPFWGVHLLYTRHATVRGVSVESDRVNNDGVDVDSSSQVVIENCVFCTGDDCIAIKSGRDHDGRSVGIPSENVVIRDCRMERGGSAGVAIGSEMSGGVQGVYIFRCNMGRVQTILNIKSNLDRGGYVENVRLWNVSVREASRVVQITTSYHGYMGGNFPPRFEDIEIDDLRCENAKEGITIRGVPGSPIRRISIRNVQVSAVKNPTSITHAEQLESHDLYMNGARMRL
jgi:polygalacturonase